MPRHLLRIVRLTPRVTALFALALAAARLVAQVSPNGGEFQVNTYTTNYQDSPAVAADAQGNFVVVWESDGSSGGDTNSYSIQGQRYATNGEPLGVEFQVNSYTTNWQKRPAVAADGLGGFVVAWESWGSSGDDSDGFSIQARRYDVGGNALGPDFQVNSFTTSWQYEPAVAAATDGSFVIVWASISSAGTDSSETSIQARRYDASGVAQGSQFQVNGYTTSFQRHPAVSVGTLGNFVVTWDSNGSNGGDTSNTCIHARRYNANGTQAGGQFQVNTFTLSVQSHPVVATDAQGGFVIAWASNGSDESDIAGYAIQARRYDASGVAQGSQFQVNSYTSSHQKYPGISLDSQGAFVVVWQSSGSAESDTGGLSVQSQRYRAGGTPLGGEFQVNTYTTTNQGDPAVATDPQGNFVVAWASQGSYGSDSSYYSVQAQRYDGLFRDGFESGDTSRWSGSVP